MFDLFVKRFTAIPASRRLPGERITGLCRFVMTALILAVPPSLSPAQEQSLAFLGAVGFGADATGWRGGDVVHVANLNDDGPGSFRACAENGDTPRVCVFDVSGTISVGRPIRVGSNLYIAGQTAPGQGIQIKLGDSNQTALVVKNRTDVLIRYLKLRPGSHPIPSANIDAITIESSSNVYLDRLSLQFASDETLNVHVNKRPTRDITIARSILALSLDDANHPKGKHSKGALICSNEGPADQNVPCGRISLIGNLFAHNRDRNPDLKATDVGPIEVINNVFYNPISQFGEFYDLLGDLVVHYVGNVAIAGPNTRARSRPRAVEAFDWNQANTLRLYVADNRNFYRPGCRSIIDLPVVDESAERFLVEAPVLPLTTRPLPSSKTLRQVLETAGARTAGWGGLDKLDQMVVDNVLDCSGRIIDSPAEVGGWPELPEISGPADSDGDGMPDRWEKRRPELDPEDPSDAWRKEEGKQQSNLEEYLSWLAEDSGVRR